MFSNQAALFAALADQNDPGKKKEKDNREHLLSADRVTCMFSATMPASVERIAKKYLRKPAIVAIGNIGQTSKNIMQTVLFVPTERQKRDTLLALLREGPRPPIIVFVNSRRNADIVVDDIRDYTSFRVATLHGGKMQSAREEALDGFKSGKFDILVATDVAGRGLDIQAVSHVINFDMPDDIDKYTHRVGRTGRAGMKGLATSIMMDSDTNIMFDLYKQLRATGNAVPAELARNPASRHPPPERGIFPSPSPPS